VNQKSNHTEDSTAGGQPGEKKKRNARGDAKRKMRVICGISKHTTRGEEERYDNYTSVGVLLITSSGDLCLTPPFVPWRKEKVRKGEKLA